MQKNYYDQRHKTKELSELKPNDKVWITNLRRYGWVTKKSEAPRSYFFKIDKRIVRKNRFQIDSNRRENKRWERVIGLWFI